MDPPSLTGFQLLGSSELITKLRTHAVSVFRPSQRCYAAHFTLLSPVVLRVYIRTAPTRLKPAPRDKQSKLYLKCQVTKWPKSLRLNWAEEIRFQVQSERQPQCDFRSPVTPCGTLIVVFLQQMFVLARLTSAENSSCEHYYSPFEMHSCTSRTSAPKQEVKIVAEWPEVHDRCVIKMSVCVCARVFFFSSFNGHRSNMSPFFHFVYFGLFQCLR